MPHDHSAETVPLGKTGRCISRLSMGCGRLPKDDDESTELIHRAIDAGINFFETATFYCDGRCCEKAGKGVAGRRDRVMLQVKVGIEEDATADSLRRETESQFGRLGVDRTEFIQFGWLTWERLPVVLRKGGPLDGVRRLQDEGAVAHLGFTGHDTPENFIKILETGLFESMTVSYNLLSRSYEPAIVRAHELGVGVIIMNPVGGGMLAAPSDTLRGLLPGGASSTPEAALRFVLSHPGVSTACSGMSTVDQLEQNLAVAADTRPLDAGELSGINAILDEYGALGDSFCTGCKYCMPCPEGVDIPANFKLHNYHTVYGFTDWAQRQYADMKPECRADRCIGCGQCEPKCPNRIPIIEQLADVSRKLAP